MSSYLDIARIVTMPLYPLYVHAHFLLFGAEKYLYMVVVTQIILAAACSLALTCYVGKVFCLSRANTALMYFLSLLSQLVSLPEYTMPHTIMTEGMAYSIFLLYVLVLLQTVFDKSYVKWCLDFFLALVLSLIRSQLEVLFVVSAISLLYLLFSQIKGKIKKKSVLTVVASGLFSAFFLLVVTFSGLRLVTGINPLILKGIGGIVEWERGGEAADGGKADGQDVFLEDISSAQYGGTLVMRMLYVSQAEDAYLIDDPYARAAFLEIMDYTHGIQANIRYTQKGLWKWLDIADGLNRITGCVGGLGRIYLENIEDAEETYRPLKSASRYVAMCLLRKHWIDYFKLTGYLLPEAFVCTVFFQVEEVYAFCYFVTFCLYVVAAGIVIYGWRNGYDRRKCLFMLSVLVIDFGMVFSICIVLFGLQRYLLYAFGIFYMALYLLFSDVWAQIRQIWRGRKVGEMK